MIYIGIDNGVSGSIGMVGEDGVCEYHKMPVKKELSYTKTKQWINRIDTVSLLVLLNEMVEKQADGDSSKVEVALERPMVNPMRFKASESALRALEATLIVVEQLCLRHRYIDSREWQKELLPSGLEKEELKVASLNVGRRLFPNLDLTRFKDADGILIAEHQRRLSNGAGRRN